MIHYHHNGIVPSAWGQFHYQTNQDDLLSMIRDPIGHELACGGCWKGFHVIAKATAFHIVCHIVAYPWPPKVACNEFCCLPPSRVSSYWIVMVRLDNVEPELIVLGDVGLSLVEY